MPIVCACPNKLYGTFTQFSHFYPAILFISMVYNLVYGFQIRIWSPGWSRDNAALTAGSWAICTQFARFSAFLCLSPDGVVFDFHLFVYRFFSFFLLMLLVYSINCTPQIADTARPFPHYLTCINFAVQCTFTKGNIRNRRFSYFFAFNVPMTARLCDYTRQSVNASNQRHLDGWIYVVYTIYNIYRCI